jgi:hypothetical protein
MQSDSDSSALSARTFNLSSERPMFAAGKSGKYTCTRCGWKWTPRDGCPDPPRACARCRSAYWQTAPISPRANSPEDPKWQAERDLVSRRRRERHLAKLKELAAEFNLEPPPILDERAMPPARGLPQPVAPSIDYTDRFNDPLPATAFRPVGRLSREMARQIAQSEPKPEAPSPLPITEPSPERVTLVGRRLGYGRTLNPTRNR